MRYDFRESAEFERQREKLKLSDEDFSELQAELNINPRAGDVIQGTGGVRKVRQPDKQRGKGKSGGIRIIYRFYEQYDMIFLITFFNKNIPDLTPVQGEAVRRMNAEFAEQLRAEWEHHQRKGKQK